MTKFQTPATLLGLAQDMILKGWQPVWAPQRQSGSFSPEAGCTGGVEFPTILPQPRTAHKLAFRPPPNVIAIDVDDYEDKHGYDTIEKAEDWLGELPFTYRVTSRGYFNQSGRYLFRIPDDLVVTDSSLYQFADTDTGRTDVEIVRTGHRFSWAPGDYHYKNDELIQCWNEDGEVCDLPDIQDIPELPEKWVTYLRNPPVPQRHEAYTRPSDGAEWWLSQADGTLGTDAELSSFAYNMLLSRCTEDEIWEQWQRVSVALNPAEPWTRSDFDRHIGSRAQNKVSETLARQEYETAYYEQLVGGPEKLQEIVDRQAAQAANDSQIAEYRERRIVQTTQYQQNFSTVPLGDGEEEEAFDPAQAGNAVDIAALIRGTPEYDRQYRNTLARMQAEKDVAKVLARDFYDYDTDFYDLPPAPDPTLLVVTGKDNAHTAVIAARTVTVLSGARASGKTWVAAVWAAQVIRAGGHVLWIDFERQNRLLREKFTALEVRAHLLREQFHYTGGMPPIGRITSDVQEWTADGKPVIMVVDAFRGLQSLIAPGTSANDGDAVEQVYMEVLNEVVAAGKETGATVAVIDHVTKSGTGGTFGSERKESAADYVIKVEQSMRFNRSQSGFSTLTITKDRYGHFNADDSAGYLWMPAGEKTGESIEQYPKVPELRNWSPNEAAELEAVELTKQGQREAVLTELVQENPLRLSINKLAADAMEAYGELFPSESTTKRIIREMVKAGKLERDSALKMNVPEPLSA